VRLHEGFEQGFSTKDFQFVFLYTDLSFSGEMNDGFRMNLDRFQTGFDGKFMEIE
jgi:hypothetical protein